MKATFIKPTLQLIRIYFLSHPFTKIPFVVGSSLFLLLNVAAITITEGINWTRIDAPYWVADTLRAMEAIYSFSLIFSCVMLPVVVSKLVSNKQLRILPSARMHLCFSVLVVILVAALIPAILVHNQYFEMLYITEWSPEVDFDPMRIWTQLIFPAYFVTFWGLSIMLWVFWIIGKSNGIWRLLNMLLIVVVFGLIGKLAEQFSLGRMYGWKVGLFLVVVFSPVWLVFFGLVYSGGRVDWLTRWKEKFFPNVGKNKAELSSYLSDIDQSKLLFGVDNPWWTALGPLIPILAGAWVINGGDDSEMRVDRAWLIFIIMLGVISGGITNFATKRSRRFWILKDVFRKQLFSLAERLYLQYCAYSLGVLMICFVIVASYFNFSNRFISLGFPLLILASLVSFYLGLLMTKSLGWLEIGLAVGTMAMIIRTAFYIGDPEFSTTTIIAIELLLLMAAVGYRFFAQWRWKTLDWMLCR